MKFTNRFSKIIAQKSLGLLASASIVAALIMVSSSASAQVEYEVIYPTADGEQVPEETDDSPRLSRKKVPANKGFQIASSVGYAIPWGDVDSSLSLSDFISGQMPFTLDLGYKRSRNFYLGGYFGYGIGQAGDMVDYLCRGGGIDCSLSTMRFGMNMQYHFSPDQKINPYLGYGMGIEIAMFEAKGPGGTGELSAFGLELARLATGFDYRANSTFGFGPYLECSLGTYSSLSDGSTSLPIADTSLHGWLNIGVRMTLFP